MGDDALGPTQHIAANPNGTGRGEEREEKMSASKTTDASFPADVLAAKGPVLVDFWAEWCGPCKAIAPTLDALAAEMGDKVKVVKLNIDENEVTPAKFGIRSIPTLLLFKDGQVVSQKVGAVTRTDLTKWVQGAI